MAAFYYIRIVWVMYFEVPEEAFDSRPGSLSFVAAATALFTTFFFVIPAPFVAVIRDDAVRAPIKVHKLRRDVSVLEGSGGNIAVLTGADGKVFIDAGTTESRPRNSSRRPTASAQIRSST
jgi:hypothetical protein